MPTAMNRSQPAFHLHDRHPLLHGLPLLLLCLAFLLGFLFSVIPEVSQLLEPPAPPPQASGLGS